MLDTGRQPSIFVGRRVEIDLITDRVRAAADHRSSVVWVEGAAGWGKTALVREVVNELSSEVTTIWAEAEELARDVPYALAAQVGPIADPNPFTAGLGLLRHLGDEQADGPVVVVVEDLHWADEPSRQALLTLARRLGHEQVVLVITSRPNLLLGDGWDRLVNDQERCATVRLGTLSTEDVRDWAAQVTGELTTAQAERLRRHTEGHPLYVRTLLNELTVRQLRAVGAELPAPRSLATATLGVLDGLHPDAQALVAAMSVAGVRTPLVELARVAGIDEGTQALEALLATGMVRWWPGEPSTPVDFTHPLYRTAVYDGLPPTRRQMLHRSMAGQVSRVESWAHRVAAAGGPDDSLADELDVEARSAVAENEPGMAIRYLLWAAPLTTSGARAEQLVLRAARLIELDHQDERFDDLISRVEACSPSSMRNLVLGIAASIRGNFLESERLLLDAVGSAGAAEVGDAAVQADALANLSALYVKWGRIAKAGDAAERALALGPMDDAVARMAWSARAYSVAEDKGTSAALDVLGERLPEEAAGIDPADTVLLLTRASIALYADGVGVVDDARTSLEHLRRGFGGASDAVRAHVILAEALERSGDWDDALRHTRAAGELIELTGSTWFGGRPEAVVGMVAAARGDLERAQEQLEKIEATPAATYAQPTKVAVCRLAAMLASVQDDPAAAADALLPLAADAHRSVANVFFATWWPPLITALIAAGRLDEAADHLDRFEARATGLSVPVAGSVLGLRARLAAANRDPEAAAEDFARALAAGNSNDFVLQRALLRHDYGRVLRALRRRREAVDELRAAHDALVELGAEPFRRVVARDLAACGVRGLPVSPRSSLTFTEREQDVVALARRGLQNRDIAQELYVSEKAVEYHLRNVYGKVGVRSRRELLALDLPIG